MSIVVVVAVVVAVAAEGRGRGQTEVVVLVVAVAVAVAVAVVGDHGEGVAVIGIRKTEHFEVGGQSGRRKRRRFAGSRAARGTPRRGFGTAAGCGG